MAKPLVSIITPTYNHEKFIGQCIESVLAQTYPDWEMIIIDDGSTDKTGKIVAQYEDERIKYIKQEHLGISKLGETYNKALQLSRGELIAILEGDDFWPPHKLERQISAFYDEAVILTWGRGCVVNEEGRTIGVLQAVKCARNKFKDLSVFEVIPKLIYKNLFYPTVTVMVRREILVSIGGFLQPCHVPFVDLPTWLRLAFRVDLQKRFRFINTVLGYRRVHQSQVSKDLSAILIGHARALEEILNEQGAEKRLAHVRLNYDNILSCSKYLRGRAMLCARQWRVARHYFSKAWNNSSFYEKVLICLGLTGSFLKTDIFEYIYKAKTKMLLWRLRLFERSI